ncbi:MAG: TlyA family RNA methyltransferase [Myxococcales bacterium]|nr:TlyA family RNA methyltransferase [Myxococcales bacterium]
MAKSRLDKLLVKRSLAASREEAQALITSGRVLVGGIPNTKTAAQVDPGVDLKLKAGERVWVSRGAHKLLGGLEAFVIDPRGMVAMDVGASTGGFTDVLLKKGASKVFAIDVGYGQLAWALRQDERVIVLDRENIRTLDSDKLGEPIDITVIDASFISLTLVLGKVAELMQGPAGKPIIALIKPQFEARKEQVGEGGVVREESVRQECVDNIRDWALARRFGIGGIVESPIRGPSGNIEFLIELRTPGIT